MENLKNFWENQSLVKDPIKTLGLEGNLSEESYDGDTTTFGRDNERDTTTGHTRGRVGVLSGQKVDKGSTVGGYGGKVGLFSGRVKQGVDVETLYGEGFVGKTVNDDGEKEFGLGGRLNTVQVERQPTEKVPVGFKAQGPNVNGEFRFNKSGFKIGGGANLGGVSINTGDKNKDYGEVGLGVGEGGGLGMNWGKNEDGKRQIGINGEIGPVNFDLRSTTVPHVIYHAKEDMLEQGEKLLDQGKKEGKKLFKKGKKGLNKLGKKIGNVFDDITNG